MAYAIIMKFLLELNHLTSSRTSRIMNIIDGTKELKSIKSVKLLLYMFTKPIWTISTAKKAITTN